MTHRSASASSGWARDLGTQAKRIFALFGGSSVDAKGRRRKDDDDDNHRPNAVVVPLFATRRVAFA